MVEVAEGRQSALAMLRVVPQAVPDAGVTLQERPHLAKVNLRGDAQDDVFRSNVGEAIGAALPTDRNTVVRSGDILVLWLGPDEWLILGPVDAETALADRIRSAVAGRHAAVVDVTDNSTMLQVTGPNAADVIAKACPIDLHARVFEENAVAQTYLAHVDVTIWRTAECDGFCLLLRRSFADHLWRWLIDAGTEFGLGIRA